VYRLDIMTQSDLPEVGRVERLCFPNPWPASAYRRELQNPTQNYYVVLRETPPDELEQIGDEQPPLEAARQDTTSARQVARRSLLSIGRGRRPDANGSGHRRLVGFAGMWLAFDEAHVTTIGVDPAYRGQGFGELLFLCMVDEAIARGANWLTLEVRVTNEAAQSLYRKYGFTVHGARKRYYSDNNEDALIMWSRALSEPEVRAAIEQRRTALAARLGDEIDNDQVSPFSRTVGHVGAS
jgi:ribosomal-protein-alanine N-acetyltransferase